MQGKSAFIKITAWIFESHFLIKPFRIRKACITITFYIRISQPTTEILLKQRSLKQTRHCLAGPIRI